MKRSELEKYLNQYLQANLYQDYGPNGLQIEGKEDVQNIAFAVSATKDSIQKAISENADTLIVHHGLFWKFHGVRTLTGTFAKRVLPLCENKMNLFGYHLPLDAHLEIGNAKVLGEKLGFINFKPFGDHKKMPTGVSCTHSGISVKDLRQKIENVCNHSVLLSTNDEEAIIKSIGIITGGANNDWTYSEKEGLDAFLTGEMSEHNWNEAKEAGISMFAAGHHATEQFGIQALMNHLETKFDLNCFYIDSQNPA